MTTEQIPCFECNEGKYERILASYETGFGYTIENVPFLQCDKCADKVIGDEGNRFIEQEIASRETAHIVAMEEADKKFEQNP